MASTVSLSLLGGAVQVRRAGNAYGSSCWAQHSKPAPPQCQLRGANRRELLFSLTAAAVMTARESASIAVDIPLFGIKKKLREVEEETVEIVKEGFETAERGVEAAEKGIKAAEKRIETAEKGIEGAEREIKTAVKIGGLEQAGAVAAAELFGVVVATSVVNGILGLGTQKS